MRIELLTPNLIPETDTLHYSTLEDLNDTIHINIATLSNELVGGIDSFGEYKIKMKNGIPWLENTNEGDN